MMKKKSGHTRAREDRAKKTEPVVPPSAQKIEKEIVSILKQLLKQACPSCLDKRFQNAYAMALALFSQYQREVLAVYPRAETCKKGCGVCCNHWPEDTYSFEVLRIADHLKKHRFGEIDRIANELKTDIQCLDRIKGAVEERLRDSSERAALGDIDPYDIALTSFYQLNRPCPLLDKNGSCSIYSIRSFTCRVYVSFSSPDLCRPEKILGDKAMTYLLDLEKDASELFDKLHFMYDVFDGETGLRAMLYKAMTK
jgi:Fe-S-cluster containining protein